MIIDITLNDFKEITANSDVIGKTLSTKKFTLQEVANYFMNKINK